MLQLEQLLLQLQLQHVSQITSGVTDRSGLTDLYRSGDVEPIGSTWVLKDGCGSSPCAVAVGPTVITEGVDFGALDS